MTRWPDFFVVGAPRSGTTSLYYYLKGHPDVFLADVKETHFFADIVPDLERLKYLDMRVVADESEYLHLFTGASDGEIIGDICPSYLPDLHAAERIGEKVPSARIIMVLRNPVERAYSHYLSDVREGNVPGDFTAVIERTIGEKYSAWGQPRMYLESGLYSEQLLRYWENFGKDRVAIFLFDDFEANPSEVLAAICDFVGISPSVEDFTDLRTRYNAYAVHRSRLVRTILGNAMVRNTALKMIPRRGMRWIQAKVLVGDIEKPRMDPAARQLLLEFYQNDVATLSGLLSRDLSSWT